MFSFFKGILSLVVAGCAAGVLAQQGQGPADFTGAQWIWSGPPDSNGFYPVGNATFRRDYFPSSGRVPISANVLITADNAYTLYVNGRAIGGNSNFHESERYCVRLEPECNVFAVEAQNQADTPNPAGLLAAIRIRFSDGFTETIVTDGEWHAVMGTPAGFEQIAFDDSAWPAAFAQGAWPNTAPWNEAVFAPSPAIAPQQNGNAPALSFDSSSYIWTNEGNPNLLYTSPAGARAFRKTVNLPAGQVVDSAIIDIVVDNEYTLYLNGLVVGSHSDFSTAQRYQVNFPPTSTLVFAVYAVNDPGSPTRNPGSILAAIQLPSCDCGDTTSIVTDSSWKYSLTIPSGFINPGFDDSNWPSAVVETFPSESVTRPATPTSNSPQSGPLRGAPSAPPANVAA